jgi:transposase
LLFRAAMPGAEYILKGDIQLARILNILNKSCCGIDVHKKTVVACVLKADEFGEYTHKIKTFSTMTCELEKLHAWLKEQNCEKVAMESTGVYWIPVFNILEQDFDIVLSNARQIKNVPGRKTDPSDSRWIAKLLALGLVNGSFIPPKDIRELREMTRYRSKLVSMRTSEKDRAHNILETCNIKLGCVATDIFGVSGMRIMKALIYNTEEASPEELAQLAKGRLRKKIPELVKALTGNMDAHHASMLEMILDHLAYINEKIEELDRRIEEKCKPYQQEIELLDTIPGVDKISAQAIVAEIGVDMSVFETPERLASWAGLSPGNNESAGKKKSTRTRSGNQYIKTVTCQCAHAAAHTKDTYLSAKFYSIKARRGAKKAAIATARHIMVAAFHIIQNKESYKELGGDYLLKLRPKNIAHSMKKRLESLGYTVIENVI